MNCTIYDEHDIEWALEVELIYHPDFDGGRDEPSESAWVEIGEVYLNDVEVSNRLSDKVLWQISDYARNYDPNASYNVPRVIL
jgi:hypothetical protein